MRACCSSSLTLTTAVVFLCVAVSGVFLWEQGSVSGGWNAFSTLSSCNASRSAPSQPCPRCASDASVHGDGSLTPPSSFLIQRAETQLPPELSIMVLTCSRPDLLNTTLLRLLRFFHDNVSMTQFTAHSKSGVVLRPLLLSVMRVLFASGSGSVHVKGGWRSAQ
jgi:hypothetical protein